jgi:hypothetical protein
MNPRLLIFVFATFVSALRVSRTGFVPPLDFAASGFLTEEDTF